jgi:hypothetical protein
MCLSMAVTTTGVITATPAEVAGVPAFWITLLPASAAVPRSKLAASLPPRTERLTSGSLRLLPLRRPRAAPPIPKVTKRSATTAAPTAYVEPMSTARPLSSFLAVAPLLFACGAADDSPTPAEPSAEDRALAAEELSQITQALGEPTCATTAADATLAASGTGLGIAPSPNAAYDHSTCRNGFVVDLPGVAAGTTLTVANPPVSGIDPLTCLFRYSYGSLYRKQGASYVKVSELTALGVLIPARFAYVCNARATFPVPTAGDYKIVAASGALFGATDVVTVLRATP